MKYSIHNKLNILFLLALFFSASSCSEPENRANQKQSSKPDHEFTVSGINDYDFLFNETDAGAAAITFNSEELKECRLSFIRANFNLGYTTRITKLGEGSFTSLPIRMLLCCLRCALRPSAISVLLFEAVPTLRSYELPTACTILCVRFTLFVHHGKFFFKKTSVPLRAQHSIRVGG
jgi:hypothetical protein